MPRLRCYLINMARSTERLQKMQTQLDGIGLAYQRFDAIDGRANYPALSASVEKEKFERQIGRPVLPGEIGCYFSHLGVWRDFLESDAEILMVMEDDIRFHPTFKSALDTALHIHEHWDFLKLNKIRAKQPVRQARIIDPVDHTEYSLNAYLGPATGLGTYLMHRRLVERLLPRMLPINRPIDHVLNLVHEYKFRHYGLEPFPSEPEDMGLSTITGQHYAEVEKFVWYRRLPCYADRVINAVLKMIYMIRTGEIFPKHLILGGPSSK